MTTQEDPLSSIPDENLRLALLDEVQGDYDWVENYRDDYEQMRSAHPGWPSWDEMEAEPYDARPTLKTFLLGLRIPRARLAKIDSLTLDGDRSVYQWVGGEGWWDDEPMFRIGDLTGLEQCQAVEYLLLGQGLVEGASLRPLSALPKLSELHLCACTGLQDIEVIADLPALEKLDVVNVETSPMRETWRKVVQAWNDKQGG